MILPNLIWILLDRGMWVSDTALYGLSAVNLHHVLIHDPANWWQEALSVGPKPPVLAWVGQFFVPIGKLVGNIDSGLLLVNFLSQGLALAFLFGALIEYCGDKLIAITGCAAVASATALYRSVDAIVRTAGAAGRRMLVHLHHGSLETMGCTDHRSPADCRNLACHVVVDIFDRVWRSSRRSRSRASPAARCRADCDSRDGTDFILRCPVFWRSPPLLGTSAI